MTKKHRIFKPKDIPFQTPRDELKALRQYEVLLSLKIDELVRLQDDMPECVVMMDKANGLLHQCRAVIAQFKVMHTIINL